MGGTQPKEVTAQIVHDVDDGAGRSVKIYLEGVAGPSFELYVAPEPNGALEGELHVVGPNGERNHSSKPYRVSAPASGNPLATAQEFANQVWAVLDQEYNELIEAAKRANDRAARVALVLEQRLRRQQVLQDILQAFTERPEPRWTGWKKGFVIAKLASHGLKLADDAPGVTGPALDQFYDIAAKAMQDGDVTTFRQFEQKLRDGLGEQFEPFLAALGGGSGLRPVWDAVVDQDPEDLAHSLEDLRISPRIPSAVQETKKQRKVPLDDPHQAERLQPDLAVMARDPKALARNISLMLQYPGFEGITGVSDEEKAEHIVEHLVDNLLWLYKQWRGEHRNRSKSWYVGGNRIVHRWAERFHIQPAAVAGILAALSPQQHWFQNVTLAERMISALTEHYDDPWDAKMTQLVLTRTWGGKTEEDAAEEDEDDPEAERPDFEEVDEPDDLESTPDNSPAAGLSFAPAKIDMDSSKRLKPYRILGNLQGKSLRDLEGTRAMNTYLQAVWIRAYSEAHNPNGCRNVSPEGEFGDWYRTDGGAPVKVKWNSFSEIMKAIRIFKDPSVRNIRDLAGANHKVRSFYNNLVAPLSQGEDVTIDTHAVAAALVRPLSSSSIEVLHNFGTGKTAKKAKPAVPAHLNPETGKMVPKKKAQKAQAALPGPTNSKVTGATGLYGFYAEAYRRAAKLLGIQPRELQSITWECVRGLFKPAQKRDKKFVQNVDNQWSRYGKGISNKDTTRNNVLAIAGSGDPTAAIEPPAWSVPHPGDAAGTRDSSYAGELSGGVAPGQGPGRAVASRSGAGAAARAAAWLGARTGRRIARLLQPKRIIKQGEVHEPQGDTQDGGSGDSAREPLAGAAESSGPGAPASPIGTGEDQGASGVEWHGRYADVKRKLGIYLGMRLFHVVADDGRILGIYAEGNGACVLALPQAPGLWRIYRVAGRPSSWIGRSIQAKLLQPKLAASTPFHTMAIVPVRDEFTKDQALTPYFQGESARAALQELRQEHGLPTGGFDILGVKFLGFKWAFEDFPGRVAFYDIQLSGDSAVVARIEQEKAQKIQQLLDGFGAVSAMPGARPRHAKLLQPKLAADLPQSAPSAPPATLRNANELILWMTKYFALYSQSGENAVEGYLYTDDTKQRLSIVMGPDSFGNPDVVTFTEGFNGKVATSQVDRTQLNGRVLAVWAMNKFGGAWPLTGVQRPVKLPSFSAMTAEQINAGALDKIMAQYPDTMFQLWLLKTWATRNYDQVGIDGSSRLAFEIDADYALKIAKNMAGMAQNQVESHIAQNFHDLPIAAIHHVVTGGAALLMDLAHNFVAADFKRDFGLSFPQFCDKVTLIYQAPPDDVKYIIDRLPQGARELMVSLQRHQLAATDLKRVDQWGDVRHHAVIIDYGLTHQVWDEHYKPQQQAAIAARKNKQLMKQQAANANTPPAPTQVKVVKPAQTGAA